MNRLAIIFLICLTAQNAVAGTRARSDTPLWRRSAQSERQNCALTPGSVQCYGFKLGNWTRRDAQCREASCEAWIELNFVGLFLSNFAYIEKSDHSDYSEIHPALIYAVAATGGKERLYVLEAAFKSGVQYMLLSVRDGEQPIGRAAVLDLRCPQSTDSSCPVTGPDT
jgi:hypothetical protein